MVDSLEKHNITFVAEERNAAYINDIHIDSDVITATIGINPSIHDAVFIEELMHIVQIANNPDYESQKLNLEIEAKLLWAYYIKTNKIKLDTSFSTSVTGYRDKENLIGVIFCLYELLNCVILGASTNFEDPNIEYYYNTVLQTFIEHLRETHDYSDSDKYQYNDEYKTNYDLFLKIIEGC